jgi:LCP family protein required for cell wall assembly
MSRTQEAPSRARSAFAAAFLSLLFPGLGHAYAGAYGRALGFAALPVLALALGAGVFLRLDRIALLGLAFDPFVLDSLFVLNLVALTYRVVAIVDAYRVTQFLNAHAAGGDGRLGPARMPRNPLSTAGLLAILLVMAGSHVVVARYDLLAKDLLDSGCIFVGESSPDAECDVDTESPAPGGSLDPSTTPGTSPSEAPTPPPSPVGTDVPSVSIPPWDGKERLNILLIGSDQRPSEGTYNTDTLIVVSIDPVTKQVAMFSIPRDTVDVPIPQGPARNVFGRVYAGKINGFFTQIRGRSDLFPGTSVTRGYNGLKAVIGELYGLDIRYFVEVNFEGFKAVVDAVGGVTINVQIPVLDDAFPGQGGSQATRVYIPTGIQHMNGDQALRYARSRHTSNDFDRARRQQRVLLSLREQADPIELIPRLPELIDALKRTVRTDIPIDQLDELLGLASNVDTKNIRSYVFTPPLYQQEFTSSPRGYIIVPYVEKIRTAVLNAFKADPIEEAAREALAEEGAQVWVLNGTGEANRGTRLAGYLAYHGLAASAPRQRPEGAVPATTRIEVYGDALEKFPVTIAFLEARFKVTAVAATDPGVSANVVVTIGRNTPALEAPALP